MSAMVDKAFDAAQTVAADDEVAVAAEDDDDDDSSTSSMVTIKGTVSPGCETFAAISVAEEMVCRWGR